MVDNIKYNEIQIFDNLHGFVRITKAEEDIINSNYFQRLRDLKQLGLGYYMFPGAVHTRFAHSIGVLFVMDRILSKLMEQNPDNIEITDVKRLRMAALLHDIGHYPLSHTIEAVYKAYHEDLIGKLGRSDEDNLESEQINDKYVDAVRDVDGHHEKLGAHIIKNTDFPGGITYILKSHDFSDEDIDIISKTIVGKSPISWYNQVLHSDLDADRLDYLMRDNMNTGVEFGGFDFDYIINNCRLEKDDNELRFCIKESACFTVEHFLMTRYYWYAKIIFEKRLVLFEEMAETLYAWLLENEKVPDYYQILKDIEDPVKFMFFNDTFFMDQIKWVIESEEAKELKDYMQFRELAVMILERKEFKKEGSITSRKQKVFHSENNECVASMSEADKERIMNNQEAEAVVKEENILDKDNNIITLVNEVDICKTRQEMEYKNTLYDCIQILRKDGSISVLLDRDYTILNELGNYKLRLERKYLISHNQLSMPKVAEYMKYLN